MAFPNPMEPLFQYLADESGFLIDQIRYVLLLLLSFPLALILRFLLHPDHTPLYVRHVYSMTMGWVLGLLCFGWEQMLILLFVIAVSYVLLLVVPTPHIHWCSMLWALSAMSVTHIYRMITDYGGYHLDFSGPLMVMVQKITWVAFSLYDGKVQSDSKLTQEQRSQKISSPPSLFHYLSYHFNFHSFLAGPTCTYNEYCNFVDGSNFKTAPNSQGKQQTKEPSILYPVLSKLGLALGSLVTFTVLGNYVDNDLILAPQFNFPYRLFLGLVNCLRLRGRYYFIWLLAESLNNCAGLGFTGYDENGVAKWDLVRNINVWELEFLVNMRGLAQNWNANTALWLRRCVYERVSFYPTMTTFAVTTIWHGFYPGYYFTFGHFALATEAARKMRRLVRPHFQGSAALRIFYDVLTWFLTHVYMTYGAVCVFLIWPSKCLLHWSYYYYLPVILSLVVILFFPSGKKPRSKEKAEALGETKQDETKTKAD